MRIRAAADTLGVEPHVLRHWEDVGVVHPPRTGSGYRDYDHETMTRLQIVLGCRDAGLSLDQTRVVLHRDADERDEIIRSRRDRVGEQIEELRRTRRFLEHVLACEHSLMSRCHECSTYAESRASAQQAPQDTDSRVVR